MIQAEIDEANRNRGIQAAQRDTCAIRRQWFQERPIQEVVNILADAVANKLENAVDNPDQDGHNGLADDEGQLALPEQMAEMNAEQMHDHIQNILGDLRNQIVELRIEQVHVGGANE